MMGKKGQAEIIGLVVVVLLLIFALVFFVKIKSQGEDKEVRLIRSNLRANSALNALMKVNIGKDQMKDLIAECFFSDSECSDVENALNDKLGMVFEDEPYYFALMERDQDGEKVKGYNVANSGYVEMKFGGECNSGGIRASPFIFRGSSGRKAILELCSY